MKAMTYEAACQKLNDVLVGAMDANGDFPKDVDIAVSMLCDRGLVTITRVEGGIRFALTEPAKIGPKHGFGITIILASWALGFWQRPTKTLLAIGPVRFVWYRGLGGWKEALA